jgi:adenylate cyclase
MAQKENMPLKSLSEQIQNIGVEKIEEQLHRILDSPEFNAAKQQRSFFEFVVKETLSGRAQEIKGYTIATCVFGRSDGFDQNSDPIVSVQANRLRRALERYYLVAGKTDPIRIDIPKGTYVPTFCEQLSVTPDTTVFDSKSPVEILEGSWPSVVVRPFENLTEDPALNHWSIGLSTDLATEITRYQEIRVLMFGPEGDRKRASDTVARFIVNGNVQKDKTSIKVTVNLVDTKTSMQIWGNSYTSDLETAQMISFQEEVAKAIAGKMSCEDGIVSKTLSIESRNKHPSDLKTYEAILRYYEYDQTFTPESFLRAMEALTLAADREPECGQVWSMLGRLHAVIYSLELPGYEATSIKKAVGFAEKGVLLNPDNQRSRAILGFVRMLDNEIPGALAEAEQALNLNPNSLFFLDGIGYLMTLLGEWKRGPALIRKAMALNPYHKPIVHHALWLDCFRQEEYKSAHLETQAFRSPLLFWDPLLKAATLGLLGRYEEAKHFVKNLLELKPDFSERGRILIKHYIKFEDIVERVVEGLHRVGLSIE